MRAVDPRLAVFGACALAAAAHVIAWTEPGRTALWGLHHAVFLPGWVPALLLALLAVALLPAASRSLCDAVTGLGERLARLHRAAPGVALGGVALALFATLPVTHGLLGDAGPRLAEVGDPDFSFRYRPHSNDTWVRNRLHHLVAAPFGASARQTYATLSSLWGLVLIGAAWAASRQLAATAPARLLLAGPVIGSGFMLLYFGYIEVYSSVTALGTVFVVLTVRYAAGRGRLWLPGGNLLLLGLHHVFGLLVAPALALAVVRRHRLDRFVPAAWRPRLGGVTVLLGFLAFWGAYLVVRPTSAVPLWTISGHIPYTILSPAHLADMANFQLLAATAAWVAVAAALATRGAAPAPESAGKADCAEPLYVAAATTFLLMFIVNPALGRLDWDLMGMHAPLWVLAGTCLLARRIAGDLAAVRCAAGALLAVSCFHTVPWVALHQAPDRVVRAIEAMVVTDAHLAGGRAMKLGVLFEHLGYLDAARRQFERDLAHDATSLQALYNLGNVHYKHGDLDTAAALYQRALDLDDGGSRTWNNLGSIRLRQRRLPEATTCFERAVALDPEFAGAYSNLGTAYFDLGRYAEAVAAYTRAADLEPALEHLQFNIGVAHTRLDDFGAAAAAFERFVRRQPDSIDGFLQLGNARARLGDRERARAALSRFLQLAGAGHPHRERALRYVRQTDPGTAP